MDDDAMEANRDVNSDRTIARSGISIFQGFSGWLFGTAWHGTRNSRVELKGGRMNIMSSLQRILLVNKENC